MTQKTALVTGASRGLGSAFAEQLALRGWHVVAVARTVGGLEDLDDRLRALALPGAGAMTLAPITASIVAMTSTVRILPDSMLQAVACRPET